MPTEAGEWWSGQLGQATEYVTPAGNAIEGEVTRLRFSIGTVARLPHALWVRSLSRRCFTLAAQG